MPISWVPGNGELIHPYELLERSLLAQQLALYVSSSFLSDTAGRKMPIAGPVVRTLGDRHSCHRAKLTPGDRSSKLTLVKPDLPAAKRRTVESDVHRIYPEEFGTST